MCINSDMVVFNRVDMVTVGIVIMILLVVYVFRESSGSPFE